jgi:hypothetical protein
MPAERCRYGTRDFGLIEKTIARDKARFLVEVRCPEEFLRSPVSESRPGAPAPGTRLEDDKVIGGG